MAAKIGNKPGNSTPPLPYMRSELDLALRLVESDAVSITLLSANGSLHGDCKVHGKNSLTKSTMVLRLHEDGRFQCLKTSVVADNSRRILELALALCFSKMLTSKRQRRAARELLLLGPAWISTDFKLVAALASDPHHSVLGSLPVRQLEDLEAYWMLLDLACGKSPAIAPALLVRHGLWVYDGASFKVQRAAVEAILAQADAVKMNEFKVEAVTSPKQVLGLFRVRRGDGVGVAHEVSLHGNIGIMASCNCDSYSRDTLRFCKHVAAVVKHVHRSADARARFLAAKPPSKPRLAWTSPFSLNEPIDSLTGLELSAENVAGQSPTSLAVLVRYFTKRLGPSVYGISPPPRAEPAARKRYLEDLSRGVIQVISKGDVDVDAAVMPLLARECDRVAWRAVAHRETPRFLETLAGLRQTLYPYQKEGVLRALSEGRFLLGDDMGLGKTTQAVAWSEALLGAGKVKRVLVICPNGLKGQWRQEWNMVSGRKVAVVDGTPDKRRTFYSGSEPVLIINYELMRRDLQDILNFAPDAVILDEAQRIKNFSTQTAKLAKQLRPRFRLVLTGTPMENRVQEFVALMDWIDDHIMGPHWRLDADLTHESTDITSRRSVKGLGLIRALAAPYFLRRRRDEVLAQLPGRTDTLLPVLTTPEQLSIHDDLGNKALKLMKILESRPLTPEESLRLMSYLTRMRVVSNGLAQYDFEKVWPTLAASTNPLNQLESLSSPKLIAFRGLVEGLLPQPGVKLVVFSQWQGMLRLSHWAIADVLRANGAEAVFFTGAQNSRKRAENIVRFHDDPRVRFFFATDAGGVGLNLQRAATVCVNLELPWNPAVLEQRIGRIHRIGQELPIQVFNLVSQRTLEERITALIANKRAVFEALFNGTSDAVAFDEDGGFYHQVRHVMEDLGITEPGGEAGTGAPPEVELVSAEPTDEGVRQSNLETQSNSETYSNPETQSNPVSSMRGVEGASSRDIPFYAGSEKSVENPCEAAYESPIANFNPVEALFSAFRNVSVERTPEGRLRVEAEGESAKLLADVFSGLAMLFRGTSQHAQADAKRNAESNPHHEKKGEL